MVAKLVVIHWSYFVNFSDSSICHKKSHLHWIGYKPLFKVSFLSREMIHLGAPNKKETSLCNILLYTYPFYQLVSVKKCIPIIWMLIQYLVATWAFLSLQFLQFWDYSIHSMLCFPACEIFLNQIFKSFPILKTWCLSEFLLPRRGSLK